MKKLLFTSLVSSSFIFNILQVKADWDYFGFKNGTNASNFAGSLYTIDSETGESTLRSTIGPFRDVDNDLYTNALTSGVTDGNNFWVKIDVQGTHTIYEYDLENDAWSNKGADWKDTYSKTQLKNLISKKANGELHIGENSWITKEEDGRQKVYAKDAAGNAIPIDYTNGTKLLINGRDVEQSINNVGALSAALTGLPTVPTDTTLACGFGTGTHGGDFAFAGGCASKVNEKLSVNYAASMTMPGQDYAGDFEDTFSARAGFVWKLGKQVKPKLISLKKKEKMEVKINSLEDKNKKLENKVSSLIARLERLEKVALGKSRSKDLASIKLP